MCEVIKFSILTVFFVLISQNQSFSKILDKHDVFLSAMNNREIKNYFSNSKGGNYQYEIIGVPKHMWNRTIDVILWNATIFGEILNMTLKKKEHIAMGNVTIGEFYEESMNQRHDCKYVSADDKAILSLSNCKNNEIVSWKIVKKSFKIYFI